MTNPGTAALIERFYDALAGDDVGPILELVSDDAVWRYPDVDGLPYGGEWRGREAVGRFLEAHDAAEEILDFRVDRTVVDGETAVAIGSYEGRAKESGRTWHTSFAHVLTLRSGGVATFTAYFDTAAALAARRR